MPINNTLVGIAAPENAITITSGHEPRVDSRLLAKQLRRPHASVQKLLTTYKADFQAFGQLRFQIRLGERAQGGGNPEKYALLNEDQSYLLLAYMRNTPHIRAMKGALVKAFSEARRAAELHQEYGPGYHALHDQIHALPGNPEHQRFVHMNANKLINKVAGIEPGGRPRADVPHKAMLIVAQHMAAQAIQGAADQSDGYARMKAALEPLAVLIGQKKSAELGSMGAFQTTNTGDFTSGPQ